MNGFTVSITAIASLAMYGTAVAETPASMTATAKQMISERLVDPGSLQIRNTKLITAASPTGKQVQILCGEYNAKNRMGGYTGFTTFVYEPIEMQGILSVNLVGKKLEFFSNDGRQDYGDPGAAVRAGMSSDEIDRRGKRMRMYTAIYAEPCLTSS